MYDLKEIMSQPDFPSESIGRMRAMFNVLYGFGGRERRMLDHKILLHDEPVVQHAMRELGRDEVR